MFGGIASIISYAHYKYTVIFVDDYNRFTWIYFLRANSKVFDAFKLFIAHVETQFATSIQTLRSDSGGKYLSTEF